jgi:hypothetical protein
MHAGMFGRWGRKPVHALSRLHQGNSVAVCETMAWRAAAGREPNFCQLCLYKHGHAGRAFASKGLQRAPEGRCCSALPATSARSIETRDVATPDALTSTNRGAPCPATYSFQTRRSGCTFLRFIASPPVPSLLLRLVAVTCSTNRDCPSDKYWTPCSSSHSHSHVLNTQTVDEYIPALLFRR